MGKKKEEMDIECYETSTSLTPEEKKRLGSYLKAFREERRLSQEQFSEITSCSPQYISDVERGKYAFSLKKILMICEHFDIPSDRLIYGSQDRYSEYDKRTHILRMIENLSVDQLDLVEEGLRVILKMLAA